MASRGVRGARKLKPLKKAERINTVSCTRDAALCSADSAGARFRQVSTELELERALRAGDRLVLLEYVAAWVRVSTRECWQLTRPCAAEPAVPRHGAVRGGAEPAG